MKLVPVKVKGIYGRPGSLLPPSMARLTPDAAAALAKVEAEIASRGGCFRLSDAYRSSAMQARAHDDFIRGRKKAYSPPAGSSMHEAGRAVDLDLAALIAEQDARAPRKRFAL
jgi:D-alanyl-D-alanine dipeptidase